LVDRFRSAQHACSRTPAAAGWALKRARSTGIPPASVTAFCPASTRAENTKVQLAELNLTYPSPNAVSNGAAHKKSKTQCQMALLTKMVLNVPRDINTHNSQTHTHTHTCTEEHDGAASRFCDLSRVRVVGQGLHQRLWHTFPHHLGVCAESFKSQKHIDNSFCIA
jgi:hypothetical protein